MKFVDFLSKSNDELVGQLKEFKKEALNLRFQVATGELSNTVRIREVRRAIAKIKTVLVQREKSGEANA